MCIYCNQGSSNNSLIRESGFHLYIQKFDNGKFYIDIDYDGNEEHCDTELEINYCPKCGKELLT